MSKLLPRTFYLGGFEKMNQDLSLQEAILQAIKTGTLVRLEADGDKIIRIEPYSAYDLNKEIIEIHGSAEIVYLGGVSLKRSITHRKVEKIAVWANLGFKVVKILYGEEIPHRIEEDLSTPEEFFSNKISKKPFGRDFLKDKLEIPPFLKNKIP